MDIIKLLTAGIAGGIMVYLKPLYSPMEVLGFVFVLDIVFGLLVDLIVNGDRLRIRKFLVALAFLTMYFLIITTTYVVGEKMDDVVEALSIVKILTYCFSYFYISNILRNMRLLAPNSRPIAFLDYFIGLQIIKRLPELAQFLRLNKNNRNEPE